MKVVILTLLSTGMRVGGLACIKMKDLEWMEEYKLYKFTVYADSEDQNDKYVTFCTPECADIINKFLDYRKKKGDKITGESPLIYKKQNKMLFDDDLNPTIAHHFNEHIQSDTIQQLVARLQRNSMLLPRQHQKDQQSRARIRKPMMRCHAFRKIFNTKCIENKVDRTVKEKLLGHKLSLGLDFHYFRPTDQQLLNEYLKVIDALTLNEENRLKRENTILKTEKKELEIENESFISKANKILLALHKKGIDLDID